MFGSDSGIIFFVGGEGGRAPSIPATLRRAALKKIGRKKLTLVFLR